MLLHALRVRRALVQHDQGIQLLDQIVAVGRYEDLYARIHHPCHQAGKRTLILWMQIEFRFIDDEQVTTACATTQIEPHIQQSANAARRLIHGETRFARALGLEYKLLLHHFVTATDDGIERF